MNSNMLYIREKSNASKKLIAKLLNTSVYTYTGYETNRLLVPNEIFIMFAKIYDIPTSDIFCCTNEITTTTIKKLAYLSEINNEEREKILTKNLSGNSSSNLSYREIKQIKDKIIDKISYKEVSDWDTSLYYFLKRFIASGTFGWW